MSRITYSIIIPHYNIPHLLQRALDSIPVREDVEVIVVDDNSDPAVVDFDHFPGLNRPNTTCILRTQKGYAGESRNIAISQARGKWILCVDADDFLLPDAFAAIDKYQNSDADVVVFKAESRMSDDLTKVAQRNHAAQLCGFIDDCACGRMDVRTLLFSVWSPWCKLVKRDFLLAHDIRFATTPCSEDVIWCAGVAAHEQRAEVSKEYIYCLTERDGSLTSNVNIPKLEIWCDVLRERNAYLHATGYDQYIYYFSYEELLNLRMMGVRTYLRFCVRCLRYGILRPCTMYGIEAKLHFKYPYLYLFLGLLNFPQVSKTSILYRVWKKIV